jgi:ABC-type transporter MlaC component
MRCALLCCAVWLGAAGAGWATTPLESTRATLEEVRAILESASSHDDKLVALSGLLRDFLDTDTMARAVLGTHWSRFTAEQQQEFLVLFRELFRRTYVQKLLLFDNARFAYVGEEPLGGAARVETKMITPRDEFAVTYQVRPQGDRWVVTDITIEDLSLTRNLHRQIERLLSTSSVEEVLSRMRKKYAPVGGAGKGGS